MALDDIYKKQGRSLRTFASEALCKDMDTHVFYPGRAGEVGGWNREDAVKVNQAKAICAQCPVQAQCLAHALKFDELYGVWGGMSSKERSRLKRRHPYFRGMPNRVC